MPIENILNDLKLEFKDWTIQVGSLDFEKPTGKRAFQISFTAQFVRFDYGMLGEDMNRIVDVMDKYDCPLYDPQVPKRYDKESQ